MKHERTLRTLNLTLSIIITIATISIITYFYKFNGALAEKQETWGQFGDFIGGTLNPLIALAALIALIKTIKLQAEELSNSSEQLKKTAAAMELQNKATSKQIFESSFFNLTKIFNEISRDLKFNNKSGKDCIKELYETLSARHLVNLQRGVHAIPTEDAIKLEYNLFHSDYGHVTGHYFRTLYNIIKLIDKSSLDEESKKFYAELLRAQLSRYELLLILYNCISVYGNQKLLPLIKKYNLLKHLEVNHLSSHAHAELI